MTPSNCQALLVNWSCCENSPSMAMLEWLAGDIRTWFSQPWKAWLAKHNLITDLVGFKKTCVSKFFQSDRWIDKLVNFDCWQVGEFHNEEDHRGVVGEEDKDEIGKKAAGELEWSLFLIRSPSEWAYHRFHYCPKILKPSFTNKGEYL